VKAVLVESFERIHRSNLIGMGVLPLQFKDGDSRESLGLTGEEIVDIQMPEGATETTRQDIIVTIKSPDGSERELTVDSRLDTDNEIAYYKCGGILQYVLNNLVANAA
jgi:aconitate hydratase